MYLFLNRDPLRSGNDIAILKHDLSRWPPVSRSLTPTPLSTAYLHQPLLLNQDPTRDLLRTELSVPTTWAAKQQRKARTFRRLTISEPKTQKQITCGTFDVRYDETDLASSLEREEVSAWAFNRRRRDISNSRRSTGRCETVHNTQSETRA